MASGRAGRLGQRTAHRDETVSALSFRCRCRWRRGDALVFQVLDKVDGEETFADAAFAVEDESRRFMDFVV